MIMKHLGILLTTYCNLNCRDCADLIPYRKNYHYDIEVAKSDLEKVLSVIDEIEEVLIIGGEILMYPHLEDIVKFCGAQPKIKRIIITTNGTIMPKDGLCQLFQEESVVVRISGYPDHVAPNRLKVMEKYRSYGVEVENFEGMTWYSMGGVEERYRTIEILKQVFSSCFMKDCVAMNKNGHIVYCSRQLAADEGERYPALKSWEYVDVRNSDDLRGDLERFFAQEYILTCNYCDGISRATKRRVPTAIQILPKQQFLSLLRIYLSEESFEENRALLTNILMEFSQNFQGVKEYVVALDLLKEWYLGSDKYTGKMRIALLHLINAIAGDYNYYCNFEKFKPKHENCALRDYQNTITVSDHPDDTSDLVFDMDDLVEYIKGKCTIDVFSYTRLYLRAQLRSLNTKNVSVIVCGLSYTQHGILQEYFSHSISNLSASGLDISYQILLARAALAIRPEIETIIMPMSIYQGYYDLASDDADYHYRIMSRIVIPVLKEGRNYEGPIYSEYASKEELNLLDIVCDMTEDVKDYEDSLMKMMESEDFFNHSFKMSPTGGLKFDYLELSEEEKYESAKKTAQLNERVMTEFGFGETKKNLTRFIYDMYLTGKKIFIFIPPMTKYLLKAHGDAYKARFFRDYMPVLNMYPNVTFMDYSDSPRYVDEDFCDFEHVNTSGARKLSEDIARDSGC